MEGLFDFRIISVISEVLLMPVLLTIISWWLHKN